MGADTVVNDTNYTTIWHYAECFAELTNPVSTPSWCNDYDYVVSTHLAALMRQDTTLRKVYYRASSTQGEQLLYDFNMVLGPYPDTYGHLGGVEVVDMDSVELADGYHKRWRLSVDNWDGPSHVIEGVGSEAGLFTLVPNTFEGVDRLYCFGTDTLVMYVYGDEGTATGCDFGATVYDIAAVPHDIFIHPNPVHGLLHISGLERSAQAVLWSATGQQVAAFRLNAGRTVVDLAGIAPGMYVLRTDQGVALQVMVE